MARVVRIKPGIKPTKVFRTDTWECRIYAEQGIIRFYKLDIIDGQVACSKVSFTLLRGDLRKHRDGLSLLAAILEAWL